MMRKGGIAMRKAILGVIVCCLLGIGTLASAGDVKIGYINLVRVKETEEWKQLEEVFRAEVSKSQLEVEQRKRELETAALQYGQQKSLLSESSQRDKEKELQKQKLEFQLWAQDRQQSLERKRDEMSQQVWSRVSEAVAKVAEKKKLTLVVDYDTNPRTVTMNFEKGFVYLAPEMDITDEVIETFNALSQDEVKE
jgi:Skp family chaperone for outer membrane proteins